MHVVHAAVEELPIIRELRYYLWSSLDMFFRGVCWDEVCSRVEMGCSVLGTHKSTLYI